MTRSWSFCETAGMSELFELKHSNVATLLSEKQQISKKQTPSGPDVITSHRCPGFSLVIHPPFSIVIASVHLHSFVQPIFLLLRVRVTGFTGICSQQAGVIDPALVGGFPLQQGQTNAPEHQTGSSSQKEPHHSKPLDHQPPSKTPQPVSKVEGQGAADPPDTPLGPWRGHILALNFHGPPEGAAAEAAQRLSRQSSPRAPQQGVVKALHPKAGDTHGQHSAGAEQPGQRACQKGKGSL